jgi:uncharacterized DUF497 family protein
LLYNSTGECRPVDAGGGKCWTSIWSKRDNEDEPRGNVQHIADTGLTIDEVEDVLYDPASRPVQSHRSGRPALIGQTTTGKTITVIYERHKDADIVTIRPVSAYEIED